MDPTTAAAAASPSSTTTTSCRPRLYVHGIPGAYRDSRWDRFHMNAEPFGEKVAGAAFLPGFPASVKLWNSGQFSTAELMFQRALSHGCRTDNASIADLFFVPAYSGALRASPVSPGENCVVRVPEERVSGSALIDRLRGVPAAACNGRNALRRGPPLAASSGEGNDGAADSSPCSVLEARGGADHILVNPRNGAYFESHPFAELDYLDPRFGAALRLAIEEPARGRWEWFDHYTTNNLYTGVPHVSMVHLEHDQLAAAPWRVQHERPQLIVGAFGIHGSRTVQRLRSALRRSCQAAASSDCFFLVASDVTNHNRSRRFSWEGRYEEGQRSASTIQAKRLQPELAPDDDPMWITTAKLYWNSTFCLQPPGDAVSRKGVADSLVMGCIPVQFHEGMPYQWPWHWGEWVHESSVLLDWNHVLQGKLDVVEKLRSIPADKVAAMQRVIAHNAHRIHYSRESLAGIPPGPGESHAGRVDSEHDVDAFDIILRRAWARARNESVVRAGHKTQRHDGLAVQEVADTLRREPLEMTGYCGHASGSIGDCSRRDGSGRLGVIVEQAKKLWPNESKRSLHIASVDACAEYCRSRCETCRYISYSLVTQTCEWYAQCNTSILGLHARDYSLWHTFRTREVPREDDFE